MHVDRNFLVIRKMNPIKMSKLSTDITQQKIREWLTSTAKTVDTAAQRRNAQEAIMRQHCAQGMAKYTKTATSTGR